MKIHSLSNLITNSSSTTYTWPSPNAEKFISNIIQNILTTLNIPGKTIDYFNISVSLPPENVEPFLEDIMENICLFSIYNPQKLTTNELKKFQHVYNTILPNQPLSNDINENMQNIKTKLENLDHKQIKTILSSLYHNYPSGINRCLSYLSISVTPINSNSNIMKDLINIFESEDLPWYNE